MTISEVKNRTLTGVVLSSKMDKTVVVKSERVFTHPDSGKIMKTVKKYKVHDEKELANEGDLVEFYEGRPVSKSKYMYLARVVKAADTL